jgi:hypothetical protein
MDNATFLKQMKALHKKYLKAQSEKAQEDFWRDVLWLQDGWRIHGNAEDRRYVRSVGEDGSVIVIEVMPE